MALALMGAQKSVAIGLQLIGHREPWVVVTRCYLMPGNDLLGLRAFGACPAGALKRVPIGVSPIGHMEPWVVITRCY